MQILSLELENAKSYVNSLIDFTAGTNAIVGENGAGKSTVVEAIGFALFDSISYRQSDFVREGAKSATITVTLLSTFDERQYQVVRRCGSSNQHFVFDPDLGVRVCDGKADVLAFLKEHMAVEPTADLSTLFRDAVGVPQGTLTAAFLQAPAARKGTFDTLLRVAEYRQVSDRLLEPSRLLRDQLQELEVRVADLQARLERLPLLNVAVQERTKALVAIKEQLVQGAEKIRQAEQKQQTLQVLQKKITSLQSLLFQAKQRLQSLAQQIELAEKALAEAAEAQRLLEENSAGFDAYQGANVHQEALQNELKKRQKLEAERTALDKSLSLHQAEKTRVEQALDDSVAAQEQVGALAEAIAEQERIEEQRNQLQRDHAALQEIERTRTTLLTNHQRLEERLAALRVQLDTGKEVELERTATEKRLHALQSALPERQQMLANFEVEAKSIKTQNLALDNVDTATCPVCEQALTAKHRDEMLARNQTKLEAMRQQYTDVRQLIQENETATKRLQKQQLALDERIRQLPRLEEITSVEKELAATANAAQSQEAQLRELADIPQRLQQIDASLSTLNDPRQKAAILQATANRLAQLKAQSEKIQSQTQSDRESLAALESQLAAFGELDSALAENRKLLQKHEAAYQLVLSYRQIAESVDARAQLVKQLADEKQAVTTEVAEYQSQLAEVDAVFDEDEYRQILQLEQSLRSEQARIDQQRAYLQQEQERDVAEIEKLQVHKRELTTIEEEMQEIEQKNNILEMIRSLFRQAGPYITKTMIDLISTGASQIFSDLMNDYSRRLQWTEDYGICLEVDGRLRQFSQLSGGEQMTAALSVRLALLREMSNIRIAFFDEPTTNLDESRRESLAQQILDVKGFEQLFVISHDDTFEQATENIIRVQRVNGVSTALTVEQ